MKWKRAIKNESVTRKTAIISGASSGIGAAAAVKFAQQGWDLIILGRNEHRLHETALKCSAVNVHVVQMDFNNPAVGESKLQSALNHSPQIKALVNNAGIFKTGRVDAQPLFDWQEMFQVNLLGSVELTKIVWPYLVKSGGGSIVNISSTLGIRPTADTGAYSALKAAMNNWTVSLAQQGGEYNIRANVVCPGIVDTPIHSFHSLPQAEKKTREAELAKLNLLQFIGKPEYIAESIYFLATDLSRWTTGATLSVDGGIDIK